MLNTVSFPGFGIGRFELNQDAIAIGDLTIKWYGVMIVLGMVFAVMYIYFRSKKTGLLVDDLMDIGLFVVPLAIVCARLYYIIFTKLENPSTYSTFKEWIDIRSGGLAIYGGLIGGAILTLIILKAKNIKLLPFFDLMAPGVMVAQAIGRWGNFFNIEAYGSETTLPWRMGIIENGVEIFVHPTFLYESLWNLLGFAIITIFYKKRRFDGQILYFYLAWYGLGRMLIEGLRTDSLYIGNTGIRVSQLVAAICFIVFTALLVYFTVKAKENTCTDNIYHHFATHYAAANTEIEKYNKKIEEKEAIKKAKKEAKKTASGEK